MKKKSIAKLFFVSLAKSLACIVIILAVGFISYKVSYAILSNSDYAENITTSDAELPKDATVDEISKNLIFVSDDKNRITHLLLEICNTKTCNMDYITIPVKTDYTIPSTMYRKLCQINPEIPQVIRVSSMKSYFSEDEEAYGYGLLIIEKMLGTDISYYTAIDEEVYENHYREEKVKIAYKTKSDLYNTPDPEGTVPKTTTTIKTKLKISVCSDSFVRQLTDLGSDEEKILEYIKDDYERIISNLPRESKSSYAKTYMKMNPAYFHYWGIPALYADGAYHINKKAAKRALKYLVENNVTYTSVQDLSELNKIEQTASSSSSSEPKSTKESSSKKDSKKLKIRVLNGSQIAGLASSTKERLVREGYQVLSVGNYTEETLTHTLIKVKKKGQGKDLEDFFMEPERKVGDVPDGYDIEIILGTADANQ